MIAPSDTPIWPRPEREPVAVTSATACPVVTSVPPRTWWRGSALVGGACVTRDVSALLDAPWLSRRSGMGPNLETGTDSPVSSDSSTRRFVASMSLASAGTRSPSESRRMSPWTSVAEGIRTWVPSRITTLVGLARSRRAFSARWVRRSWITVIEMTTTTDTSSSEASIASPINT